MVGRINKLAMISIVFLSQLTRQNVSLEAYISEDQDFSNNAQQLKQNEGDQKEEMSLKEISDQDNKCKIPGKTLLTENKSSQVKKKEIMKEKVGTQQDQKQEQDKNQYEKYQQQTEQKFQKLSEINDHKLKFIEQSNKKYSRLLGGNMSTSLLQLTEEDKKNNYFSKKNPMPSILEKFIQQFDYETYPVLEYKKIDPSVSNYDREIYRLRPDDFQWQKNVENNNCKGLCDQVVELMSMFREAARQDPLLKAYIQGKTVSELDTTFEFKKLERGNKIQDQVLRDACYFKKNPEMNKEEYYKKQQEFFKFYQDKYKKGHSEFVSPFTIDVTNLQVENNFQMAQVVFKAIFNNWTNFHLLLSDKIKFVGVAIYPSGKTIVGGRFGVEF